MTPTVTELDLVSPTDQRLNQKSEEIKPEDIAASYIQGVIDRMLELAAGKGHSKHDSRQMVGLAAPQIGANVRIVAIDMTADGSLKEQRLKIFINPRITLRSTLTTLGREGCWSCGNICGAVERSEQVTVEAYDRGGLPFTVHLNGFTARIAQHEIDHLDGIRFPDRIPEDQPDHLHWVNPEQFADYRTKWEVWPVKCPREKWETMKRGDNV